MNSTPTIPCRQWVISTGLCLTPKRFSSIGNIHTNTIEGFWSLSKNGIRGTYHAVSDKYLQHYLDEYSFRYNHRNDESPMFLTMLQKVAVDS